MAGYRGGAYPCGGGEGREDQPVMRQQGGAWVAGSGRPLRIVGIAMARLDSGLRRDDEINELRVERRRRGWPDQVWS
jgi:hypothetical protein